TDLGDGEVEAGVHLAVGVGLRPLAVLQAFLQVAAVARAPGPPRPDLGGAAGERRPPRPRVLPPPAPPPRWAPRGRRRVAGGGGGGGGDEGAAGPPPPRLDVAGLLERLQRVPDRDPAHAEARGQVALGRQAIALEDDAELDGVQDPLDRLLEDVAGADGPED